MNWLGPLADIFGNTWQHTDLPSINHVRHSLQELKEVLNTNREEQERTSSHSDALQFISDFGKRVRPLASKVNDFSKDLADDVNGHYQNSSVGKLVQAWEQAQEEARAVRRVANQLEYADRTKSKEGQLTWWESLSEVDQQRLLDHHPGRLTDLEGLPDATTQQAKDNYLASIAEDLEVSSTTHGVAGELDFEVVKFGADGEIRVAEMADGSFLVTTELGADVSAKYKMARAGVAGEIEVEHRFETRAAAEQFRDDLIDAATPGVEMKQIRQDIPFTDRHIPLGLRPDVDLGGPSQVWDMLDSDVQGGIRESFKTSAAVEVGAELPDNEFLDLGGKAGLGYSHDFETGDDSVFFRAEGELNLEVGSAVTNLSGIELKGGAAAKAQVEVGFDSEGINEIVLEFEGSAAVGGSLNPLSGVPGADLDLVDVQVGGEVQGRVEIDTTDPLVRQKAMQFLNQEIPLSELLDESEIQIQVDGTSRTGSSLEFGPLQAENYIQHENEIVTIVKPSGGDFFATTL